MDICVVCGKEYIVTGGNQKYCPKCAKEAVAKIDRIQGIEWYRNNADNPKCRENRKKTIAEIPCPVCGKMFRPTMHNQVTCSDACRKIRIKKRNSEYAKAHRAELNERNRLALRQKISSMIPDELRKCRERTNERARILYAKRKAKKKVIKK